nr:Allergen Act D like [Ipomoea batatas]
MKMMKKLTALVLFLCTIFHVGHCRLIIDGLVPNGNFEQGPQPSQMKGSRVIDPHAIPKWVISSGFVEYIKSGEKQVTPNSEPNDWGMLPLQTMYSSTGFDTYSWAFLAESNRIQIVLHNPAVEKDPSCCPIIDSVALKLLNPPRRLRGTYGDGYDGNMLKNGDFEEGPYILPNTSWGVLIPPNIEDDHSPLPGWIIESLKAVKYIDSNHFLVPSGTRAVELVAGRESALVQIVRTIPGKVYDLMFSVGDANNSCEGSMGVEAFAGKLTLKVPYSSKGKGGYLRAKHRFTAVSNRTRIRFLSSFYHMKSDNSGSLCGPVIDDVRLVGVRNPRIHF